MKLGDFFKFVWPSQNIWTLWSLVQTILFFSQCKKMRNGLRYKSRLLLYHVLGIWLLTSQKKYRYLMKDVIKTKPLWPIIFNLRFYLILTLTSNDVCEVIYFEVRFWLYCILGNFPKFTESSYMVKLFNHV